MTASALQIVAHDLAPGARRLELSGRLDARTYGQLDEAVAQAAQAGVTKIVADVAAVEHLSAAGTGALLAAQSVLAERGGGIALCGVGLELGENLELLGLADVFPVGATPEEALAAL